MFRQRTKTEDRELIALNFSSMSMKEGGIHVLTLNDLTFAIGRLEDREDIHQLKIINLSNWEFKELKTYSLPISNSPSVDIMPLIDLKIKCSKHDKGIDNAEDIFHYMMNYNHDSSLAVINHGIQSVFNNSEKYPYLDETNKINIKDSLLNKETIIVVIDSGYNDDNAALKYILTCLRTDLAYIHSSIEAKKITPQFFNINISMHHEMVKGFLRPLIGYTKFGLINLS